MTNATGFFWVRNSSPDQLNPIDIALALKIVSLEDTRLAKISALAVEMKTTTGWMPLTYLPVNTQTNPSVGARLYWGQRNDAQEIAPESDIFDLDRKQFTPGETNIIGGFFEYSRPTPRLPNGKPVDFRITVINSAGKEFVYLASCGKNSTLPKLIDVDLWDLKVLSLNGDISQLPIKRLP
jgi:hypothetical protein